VAGTRVRGIALALVAMVLLPGAAAPRTASAASGAVARPLVFIPGFGGSNLYLEHGSGAVPTRAGAIGNPAISSHTQLWLNLGLLGGAILSGRLDATLGQIDYSTGSTPRHLVPGLAPRRNDLYTGVFGYGDVVPFFTSKGYVLDRTLFIVTYDWTAPAEGQMPAVEAAVGQALSANPGADGVDIVAHSMGTLVARSYLRTGNNASNVKHVVLLGGPLLGDPDGSNALMFGKCLGPILLGVCPVAAADVQFVFRTLPGGAELGVSPAYYNIFNAPGESDPAHPVPFLDVRPVADGGIPGSGYARLRQEYLLNHVTPSNLDSAETYHADDTNWLRSLPRSVNPNVALVAGTGQCTIGQIRETVAPAVADSPGSLTRSFDYRAVDGDTEVVRQSAALEDPARGISYHGRATVYYRTFTHDGLVRRGQGLDLAYQLVTDDRTVAPGHPEAQSASCTIVSVHSPMQLVVTDGRGRKTGLTGSHEFDQIPGASYQQYADMKLAVLPSSGTYTVSLAGTASGAATVRVRQFAAGTLTRAYVYAGIGTTAATKASMRVRGATGAGGALAMDVRGDGKTVQTINPTELTGASARDTAPPVIGNVSPQDGAGNLKPYPLVSWKATDQGSGLSSTYGILDQGTGLQRTVTSGTAAPLASGTHALDVYAADNAGNWSHARSSFTIP
jgi:pimeloyl-ACP methyl ester carboxylesterase